MGDEARKPEEGSSSSAVAPPNSSSSAPPTPPRAHQTLLMLPEGGYLVSMKKLNMVREKNVTLLSTIIVVA